MAKWAAPQRALLHPCLPPQELWFLPGPLSATDFAALVDSVAVVGSTAVSLSAVLDAVHSNMAGSDSHPLPPELEVGPGPGQGGAEWGRVCGTQVGVQPVGARGWGAPTCHLAACCPRTPRPRPPATSARAAYLGCPQERVDATTNSLAAVFALLAASIQDTLEGCCLQRHKWENRAAGSAAASAVAWLPWGQPGAAAADPVAPEGSGSSQDAAGEKSSGSGLPSSGSALSPAAGLAAATAEFNRLARAHEAARETLAPSASDLAALALGALLVLLQQARAVAAVLQAAAPSAGQPEMVQPAADEKQADKV